MPSSLFFCSLFSGFLRKFVQSHSRIFKVLWGYWFCFLNMLQFGLICWLLLQTWYISDRREMCVWSSFTCIVNVAPRHFIIISSCLMKQYVISGSLLCCPQFCMHRHYCLFLIILLKLSGHLFCCCGYFWPIVFCCCGNNICFHLSFFCCLFWIWCLVCCVVWLVFDSIN